MLVIVMKKQIAITEQAHERAKAKAERAGMKFYRFVEAALEAFNPPPMKAVRHSHREKQTAG